MEPANLSDYMAEIRSLAESIVSESLEYERPFFDQCHESIDGHEFVIYTAKARAVLALSSNSEAYVDNFGSEGMTENGEIRWEVLAFCAMEQDIFDYLHSHGWDGSGDDDEETFANLREVLASIRGED